MGGCAIIMVTMGAGVEAYGLRMFSVFMFQQLTLMMASVPVVDFYANPPAAWNIDPMADQLPAGGLAWSYGELPSVLMLMFVLARWQRDDAVTSRAKDRQELTGGTPQLDAYNAYLLQLRQRTAHYDS